MNPYMLGGAAAGAAALLAGAYLYGMSAARADCREKLAAINAKVQAESLETARRVDRLHVEIEGLRARPEKIRTVVREVKVYADADCSSLPDSYRSLWNARPREAEPASAAAVGDAGLPGVAESRRDGASRN